MNFIWSCGLNPSIHHFEGYHGFFPVNQGSFYLNNKLPPIPTNNPKKIHEEFFGYVYLFSPKLPAIPNSKFMGVPNTEQFGCLKLSWIFTMHSPLAFDLDVGCYRPTIKSPMVFHHLHQTHMHFHIVLLYGS